MVIERVATSGAKVAGTGIGAAAGRFISNPRVLLLAALGIGLFVFRDKISDFFAGLKFPEINLPEINFPEFDFPEFPTLPPLPTACSLFGIGCEEEGTNGTNGGGGFEFPNLCSLFGIGCDEPDQPLTEEDQFDDSGLAGIDLTPSGEPAVDFNDAEIFAEDFPEEPTGTFGDQTPPPPIIIDPDLETEGEFVGGGPSFIGGSINETPVTTLFQVLDLFGGFSASQAANFLFQFSGISPTEALDLDQFKSFQ